MVEGTSTYSFRGKLYFQNFRTFTILANSKQCAHQHEPARDTLRNTGSKGLTWGLDTCCIRRPNIACIVT